MVKSDISFRVSSRKTKKKLKPLRRALARNSLTNHVTSREYLVSVSSSSDISNQNRDEIESTVGNETNEEDDKGEVDCNVEELQETSSEIKEEDLNVVDDSSSSSSNSDSSYSDDKDPQNSKLDVGHCISVGKVLIEKGLVEHFNSLCGGKQKAGVIKYILRRTSQLLIWTFFYKQSSDLVAGSVIQWYAELIEQNYTLLERFVTSYLDETRGLTAATCYNYLCDIAKSFKWFIWYRRDRCNENPVDGNSAGGFNDLINQLRKNLKPARQKQRVAHTLRNMVAKHRFPPGGINELRTYIEDGIQWAISIDPLTVINRRIDYNRFLSIIISALYLFSAQGRIGGWISYLFLLIYDITVCPFQGSRTYV